MIEMMKAAIFVEPGKMTVEEVPKATLRKDDDIVIRVVRTCVCGSDLWFFRGLSGQAAHSQVGHESIGVVEEVGAAVESVKPGDFVVVPFPYSCGKCPVCKAGFESVCPHGGYFSACQAEYLRVPEADGTVVKVPGSSEDYDDATLASLLTISDVMSTGYHAAASADVKPGDTAVVMGDGAVGLCGVIAAKMRGATRIIAMSRHEDRAALAREGTFYGNIGIKGGPAPVRHYDLDAGLLDAVLEGRINPGRVFTAEYDLDHIQDAYEAMDQRKVIKALIRL